MNLAIEYLLRTGIASYSFRAPCSLFLTGDNPKKRIVVTIRDDVNAFLVSRWNLSKCDPQKDLPESAHIRITSREELFSSHAVVMPGYSLLNFHQSKENYSPEMGESEEIQILKQHLFRSKMLNIFNSKHHVFKRHEWLWGGFLDAYGVRNICDIDTLNANFRALNGKVALMSAKRNDLAHKWERWLMELDLHGQVAPELIFWDAYRRAAA